MSAIIITVIPVFALIVMGSLAAKFKMFSGPQASGLNLFVNYIAIPALLFRTMLKVDISQADPWSIWASFYLAWVVVWIIALIVAHNIETLKSKGGAASALSSTFGNLVLMGLPLAYVHFGERALIPAALIVAIHAPIQWFCATLRAEWAGRSEAKPISEMLKDMGLRLVKNPIIASLIAGFIWNFTGLGLHEAADKIITMLGQAGVPTALFALGLSIAGYSFKGQLAGVATILTFKMAIFPAMAWVLAIKVLNLPPIAAGVVILFAAMPPGVNAYLFATQYKASVEAVSGAVAFGTAISMITIPLVLWFIGPV